MHDYWLVCPTHTLFRFNRAPCIHPHCATCSFTYMRPPQGWRASGLLNAAAKHVDAFIAPSRFSQALHHERGLNVPIVHLPHFVPAADPGVSTREELTDEAPDAPYFLFVGRLEKLKGLQTLIPIFRRYQKAQLLVAGTGTYEPALRRLAGGMDNVRFLGFLSTHQLQALYRQAVAVIVPSIWFEVFGQVIIEAFQQGSPVIVRNMGGMPEIVQDSGGGLTYTTDEELVTAMDQLVEGPAYRRELGVRGYREYQRKFTVDAHLQRYFALINEIAARGGGRHATESQLAHHQ